MALAPVPLFKLLTLTCTAAGKAVLNDGTPPALVTNTEELAVVKPATVLAALLYKIWLAVVVAGHVAVDQAGVVLEPDCSI